VPSFRSVVVSDDKPIVDLSLLPEMDWRIFGFVSSLTVLTGIAFGLTPALRATRIDLASDLKDRSRSISGSGSLFSKSLLVAQVAISVVLVVGAGLFLNTVRNLHNEALGFNPQHLMTFHVSLRAIVPLSAERSIALYRRIMEKVSVIPGVRSIG